MGRIAFAVTSVFFALFSQTGKPAENPLSAYLTLQKNPRIVAVEKTSSDQTCIENLVLYFDKSINLATLQGSVYSQSPLSPNAKKQPFLVEHHSPDFRRFVLRPAKRAVRCHPLEFYENIAVSEQVANTAGGKLSQALHFQAENLDLRAGQKQVALSSQEASTSFWRTSSPSFLSVGADDLNRAQERVARWQEGEKQASWNLQALTLLPLQGTNLVSSMPSLRENQYAGADVILVLRRAAVFVSALFPEVRRIGVGDVSDPRGQTPSVDLGGTRIAAHPEGSHTGGNEADVSYLTGGDGFDPRLNYDFERNFWFLYSVLQSTGVDLVITAYKEKFLEIGRRAVEHGLITKRALGRFNMLMDDANLNHDKHIHITVRNADNRGRSLRFLPKDDVYACYLALDPRWRGGNLNFCE